MKTNLFTSISRGHENHGWLDTFHTFSFANYYDSERVNFGALRVINDDIVLGGEGFGRHSHDNMEIISIPLYGALEHKDSMGNLEVLKAGDVQVMSAGKGIFHSEYNSDENKPVNFFQIWIFPNEKNLEPRYDQKNFDFIGSKNSLIKMVGPKGQGDENDLWINQDAWLSSGIFDKEQNFEYKVKKEQNGAFFMVIEGEFKVADQKLTHRDGFAVWDAKSVKVEALSENSRILIIDVPIEF